MFFLLLETLWNSHYVQICNQLNFLCHSQLPVFPDKVQNWYFLSFFKKKPFCRQKWLDSHERRWERNPTKVENSYGVWYYAKNSVLCYLLWPSPTHRTLLLSPLDRWEKQSPETTELAQGLFRVIDVRAGHAPETELLSIALKCPNTRWAPIVARDGQRKLSWFFLSHLLLIMPDSVALSSFVFSKRTLWDKDECKSFIWEDSEGAERVGRWHREGKVATHRAYY